MEHIDQTAPKTWEPVPEPGAEEEGGCEEGG
jgi:hypothetical protein